MASRSSSPPHKGPSPLVLILAAIPLLLLWLAVTFLRVQTSESLMLGGGAIYVPNWRVALQPLQLLGIVGPVLDALHAKADLFGWGIETIYLGIVGAGELLLTHIRKAGKWWVTGFIVGVILLIGFDIVSDFLYGTMPSGFWGQAGFTFIAAFIELFFGILGFYLLIEAVKSFMHP